ncbi:MAG: DNA gyrase subunit A, partial [Ignavibacteriales bacterium]|nr:DNA gyrase subunit A [Ignavibacteriales bacterium]
NLIINGSSGIAVGMATNIPPHNLGEVIGGLVTLLENPDARVKDLMSNIKGPDFPTGGIIYGYEGVKEAYKTGRGRILVRAKASIETGRADRQAIVVTEIPYQVNKATLIERIAELVRDKKIEDISDIRDESDRDGLRVVIELKRDANASVVLNNLYKHTQMQTTFGIIMLALVEGRPQVLTLRQMIDHFIKHRNEVIIRRTKFDLDEAEKKAHILEGYIIALQNIDEIIKLIKKSKDVQTAQEGLMKRFKLSEIQAKAILDMRLQRLTGLERKKVEEEYKETIKLIEKLKSILSSKKLQLQLIKEVLLDVKKKFGDERRTEIIYKAEEFSVEDMIAEEDVVITISHSGFIKRFPVSGYRRQARGGKGVMGAATKEDDFIEHMFIASTHDYILFFTDTGRCHWLKVHEIPEAGRMARGKSIVNLIEKQQNENIAAFVPVKEFDDTHYVAMVTEKGLLKKTALSEYGNVRRTGIAAITLQRGDCVKDVKLTDGNQDIIIGTYNGMAIRFNEQEARPVGRTSMGVRAIKISKSDKVIGAVAIKRQSTTILVVAENGYGKRSELDEYRVSHRGGKGVITIRVTEKTGNMVAIKEVLGNDDIVVVTNQGVVIRQPAETIRIAGRNTQGVRLIRLDEGDKIADTAVVPAEGEKEETEEIDKTDDEIEKKNILPKSKSEKNSKKKKG